MAQIAPVTLYGGPNGHTGVYVEQDKLKFSGHGLGGGWASDLTAIDVNGSRRPLPLTDSPGVMLQPFNMPCHYLPCLTGGK